MIIFLYVCKALFNEATKRYENEDLDAYALLTSSRVSSTFLEAIAIQKKDDLIDAMVDEM